LAVTHTEKQHKNVPCYTSLTGSRDRAGSPITGAKQYCVQRLCPHTPTVHRITHV